MVKIEYVMIALYVAAVLQAAATRQSGKALYWIGAIVLTIGVLRMKG